MTSELFYATNRAFKRIPPAPVDSVVVVGASGLLRDVYLGNGKGGGDPGSPSSGTARTVALTASAIHARNYAGAARAAFCGTAAHMGDAKSKGVDLAAIGHGALDLLGFIPGIGAAGAAKMGAKAGLAALDAADAAAAATRAAKKLEAAKGVRPPNHS